MSSYEKAYLFCIQCAKINMTLASLTVSWVMTAKVQVISIYS